MGNLLFGGPDENDNDGELGERVGRAILQLPAIRYPFSPLQTNSDFDLCSVCFRRGVPRPSPILGCLASPRPRPDDHYKSTAAGSPSCLQPRFLLLFHFQRRLWQPQRPSAIPPRPRGTRRRLDSRRPPLRWARRERRAGVVQDGEEAREELEGRCWWGGDVGTALRGREGKAIDGGGRR